MKCSLLSDVVVTKMGSYHCLRSLEQITVSARGAQYFEIKDQTYTQKSLI